MGSCGAVLVESLEPEGCRCPGGRVPGNQDLPLRMLWATGLLSWVGGGGVREAGGARRGGPPRDVAVPLRLEMPEGASLEQGPGKTAAAGNSAFAGELKKGLLRLWFGDQTPGTRPECLRPRSEVSLPMSEGTEFLTMGCVFF